MQPRTKKLLGIGVGLTLVVVLLVVGVVWFAMSKLQDPVKIAAMIKGMMGPGFDGKIELKEIAYVPLTSVSVNGLQITMPSSPEKPLFKCDKLEVGVAIHELVSGRLSLKSVKATGWEVNLVRAANGVWNIPAGAMRRASIGAPLVPNLGTAMLATAVAVPSKAFSIDSLELDKGSINVEDKLTTQTGRISAFGGRMMFDGTKLSTQGLEGRLLDAMPLKIVGEVIFQPAFAVDFKFNIKDLDAKILQEKVPILNGLRTIGTPWAGTATVNGGFKSGGPAAPPALEAELIFHDFSICEPMYVGRTLSIGGGTIKVDLKLSPAGIAGSLDLALDHPNIIPLDAGLEMPFDSLTGGLDFVGQTVTVRSMDGKLGGGTVSLKGQLQALFGSLDLKAAGIPMGPLLSRTTVFQDHPWTAGAVIKSVDGKASVGEFTFNPLELQIGASTISVTGGMHTAGASWEPAGVKGSGDIDGGLVARLAGFADPSRVTGKAAIEFTLQPNGFTTALRTSDLQIKGAQPAFEFKGLAANINGLRQQKAGQMRVSWAANLRAGLFTLLWPTLMKAAELPIEGAVKFKSGDAALTYDQDTLNVQSLKLTGDKVDLEGKLSFRPDGGLSGELVVKAFSAPGVVFKTFSAAVSGTVAAPKMTPR